MERWQRDYIRRHLPQLVADTVCGDHFLELLNTSQVISQVDIEILNSISKGHERNSAFYVLVQPKRDAYQPLVDALRETNQMTLADLLERGYDQQVDSTQTDSVFRPSSSSSYKTGTGELSVPKVNVVPATPPLKRATPNAKEDPPTPPTQDEVDFVNNMDPLVISVTKPQDKMAFPDDHYGLREDFKGYALVLNIIDFLDRDKNRAGAQMDTVYMTQLWTALGYKVTTHEGYFTSSQVYSILEAFASQFTQESEVPTSCVVFIGSHGSFSKIEASDHEPINLFSDIIYRFDSSQCPQLQGKAKIFIIQACQRFEPEAEAESDSMMPMALQAPIDDTIICYSTIPGYVANRDVYLGTWYVYCLAKVIMEEAHQTHLFGLLKQTQEAMRNINADAAQGQMSAYMDFGIKMLYFNMHPE